MRKVWKVKAGGGHVVVVDLGGLSTKETVWVDGEKVVDVSSSKTKNTHVLDLGEGVEAEVRVKSGFPGPSCSLWVDGREVGAVRPEAVPADQLPPAPNEMGVLSLLPLIVCVVVPISIFRGGALWGAAGGLVGGLCAGLLSLKKLSWGIRLGLVLIVIGIWVSTCLYIRSLMIPRRF